MRVVVLQLPDPGLLSPAALLHCAQGQLQRVQARLGEFGGRHVSDVSWGLGHKMNSSTFTLFRHSFQIQTIACSFWFWFFCLFSVIVKSGFAKWVEVNHSPAARAPRCAAATRPCPIVANANCHATIRDATWSVCFAQPLYHFEFPVNKHLWEF